MRILTAHDISARIEYGGRTLDEACKETVLKKMSPDSGGVIAVDRNGSVSMPFNSVGMFRGHCDSTGVCEVGIWEEMLPVSSLLAEVI